MVDIVKLTKQHFVSIYDWKYDVPNLEICELLSNMLNCALFGTFCNLKKSVSFNLIQTENWYNCENQKPNQNNQIRHLTAHITFRISHFFHVPQTFFFLN